MASYILSLSLLTATPRARELEIEIPSALSEDEITHGGAALYLLGIFFLFLSLRELCECYFMPVIEYIIERYSIKRDIAAATIMAMGGSAPELFISFFGVFLAESSIGIATILGSGAFNGMVLVGICSLTAKTALNLQWWQVVRDFFFYSLILVVLIVFSYDLKITWWEGLVLCSLYALYIYFMKHNSTIEKFVKRHLNVPYEGDEFEYEPLPKRTFIIKRHSLVALQPYMPSALSYRKGVLARVMKHSQLNVARSSDRAQELLKKFQQYVCVILRAIELKKKAERRHLEARGLLPLDTNDNENGQDAESRPHLRKLQTLPEYSNDFAVAQISVSYSKFARLRKLVLLPLVLLWKLSIPGHTKHKNCWLLTLLMCVLWIGVLAFLLVWSAADVGKALGVPDGVLGMLFLAAGVSIPDIVNSLKVTAEEHGDMVLSGSLGSNILNGSLGLGLPFLLYGLFSGDFTQLNEGILYSEVFLLCFLGLAYIFTAGFKWQLSRHLGGVLLFFYLSFILLYLVFELK